MTTLETLRRLCEADGVSGDEGAASKAAAELLAAYTSDVKIDDFGSAVPEKQVEKINKVKDKMIAGDFKVFSGEIKYNDGSVLCKKGQELTNEEIWKINKEVAGVTATSK